MAGRATDITHCSELVESEAPPADRAPLSIPSAGAAMVADEGVERL